MRGSKRNEEIPKRILAAARTVFFQKGYLKATMVDIQKICKVDAGNIYRYYKKKEVLICQICEPVIAELDSILDSYVYRMTECAPKDSKKLFKENCRKMYQVIIENREATLILMEHCAGTPFANYKSDLIKKLSDGFIKVLKNLSTKRKIKISTEKLYIINILAHNQIAMYSNISKCHTKKSWSKKYLQQFMEDNTKILERTFPELF